VSNLFYRRLGVLLVSAAAAFGLWQAMPGTELDRRVFTMVLKGFANPPFFVSGEGSHASPWQLRALSPVAKPDPEKAPVIVSLGDDPDGFFQSSPPAPIDLAVILSNFQRLGVKKAGVSAVLAWEIADVIGLAALEQALGRFESLTFAAPLSRAAVPAPILPGFRRASLPLDQVRGDVMDLPVVNRCPIPDVVLGGENALAGFSVLESEPAGELPFLVARWEDRAVFSYALLAVLQRLDLPPDGVEVRLGESIRLSQSGPVVPIDDHGRLSISLKPMAARAVIPAESLIGGEGLLPEQGLEPVILRDDRSVAEPATRAFSRDLPAWVTAIASEAGLGPARPFPRLAKAWEWGVMSGMVLLLVRLCSLPEFARNLCGLVLIGVCVASQWVGLGMASVWLPGLPLSFAVLSALVVSGLIGEDSARPAPVATDETSSAPPVSDRL
jgi:hypothetical protein